MKACYLVGPRKTEIREIPIPEIKDDEIPVSYTHLDVYKRQARSP